MKDPLSMEPRRVLLEQPELRVIWVQAETKSQLIKALKAGYSAASPLDAEKPVLVFTRNMARVVQ